MLLPAPASSQAWLPLPSCEAAWVLQDSGKGGEKELLLQDRQTGDKTGLSQKACLLTNMRQTRDRQDWGQTDGLDWTPSLPAFGLWPVPLPAHACPCPLPHLVTPALPCLGQQPPLPLLFFLYPHHHPLTPPPPPPYLPAPFLPRLPHHAMRACRDDYAPLLRARDLARSGA